MQIVVARKQSTCPFTHDQFRMFRRTVWPKSDARPTWSQHTHTHTQVRVQRTARLSAAVSDTMELQDTAGDEEAVLVVVDPQELPRTWASLDQLGEQMGEGTYRATPDDAALEQSVTMEEQWRPQMTVVVSGVQQAARITLGDMHLDAKLFPHLHPHGSGSLRAEDDKVSMTEYLQHRLMSLQHDFRQSPVWSFWSLDRLIKNDL